jgi:hypothetical protein
MQWPSPPQIWQTGQTQSSMLPQPSATAPHALPQVFGMQTQAPCWHACWGPEQASQICPVAPQFRRSVPGWQLPAPSQQPEQPLLSGHAPPHPLSAPAHLPAHCGAQHVWRQQTCVVCAQSAHGWPSSPQASSSFPPLQIVPAQQPAKQLVPSQTHWPASQRWPVAHAVQTPAAQTASAPQQTLSSATQA